MKGEQTTNHAEETFKHREKKKKKTAAQEFWEWGGFNKQINCAGVEMFMREKGAAFFSSVWIYARLIEAIIISYIGPLILCIMYNCWRCNCKKGEIIVYLVSFVFTLCNVCTVI